MGGRLKRRKERDEERRLRGRDLPGCECCERMIQNARLTAHVTSEMHASPLNSVFHCQSHSLHSRASANSSTARPVPPCHRRISRYQILLGIALFWRIWHQGASFLPSRRTHAEMHTYSLTCQLARGLIAPLRNEPPASGARPTGFSPGEICFNSSYVYLRGEADLSAAADCFACAAEDRLRIDLKLEFMRFAIPLCPLE